MVDSLYTRSALSCEEAWALLRNGEALSAARNAAHLFSFRIRPGPTRIVLVLLGPAYEEAGWLEPGAEWLVMDDALAGPTVGRAGRYHPDVMKTHRLFNGYLLKGLIPEDIDLVRAKVFERERCLAFQAAEPDVYRFLIGKPSKWNADLINRIRNCATISEGQRRALPARMEKAAFNREFPDPRQRRAERSRLRRVEEDGDKLETPAAQARREQREAERDERQRRDRQMFPEDYE